MSTYRSKQHHIPKGPGLLIRFKVKNELVTDVNLTLIEEGITWEIEADKSSPAVEKKVAKWLQDYAEGRQPAIEIPTDISHLPSFTNDVLQQLQKLPFGEVLSYQEVAKELRHPRAARAVGNACGRNPIPLIIPCHRVIASDRTIGGFSMGPSIKKALLAFENVSLS
jgi:O-6-methylguanine DNA methyltransferase